MKSHTRGAGATSVATAEHCLPLPDLSSVQLDLQLDHKYCIAEVNQQFRCPFSALSRRTNTTATLPSQPQSRHTTTARGTPLLDPLRLWAYPSCTKTQLLRSTLLRSTLLRSTLLGSPGLNSPTLNSPGSTLLGSTLLGCSPTASRPLSHSHSTLLP
eukprot:353082-Chlamydomonas_euryale.AAC.2